MLQGRGHLCQRGTVKQCNFLFLSLKVQSHYVWTGRKLMESCDHSASTSWIAEAIVVCCYLRVSASFPLPSLPLPPSFFIIFWGRMRYRPGWLWSCYVANWSCCVADTVLEFLSLLPTHLFSTELPCTLNSSMLWVLILITELCFLFFSHYFSNELFFFLSWDISVFIFLLFFFFSTWLELHEPCSVSSMPGEGC